jgi:lysophospholipase L1-like esterase
MRTLKTTSMRRPRSTQRQLFGAALVSSLAMAAVLALPGSATPRSAALSPQNYYLALGDSIAYGIQPTKVKPGAGPSAFRTGYVDAFAARLRKLSPKLQVVNYGCPGESTRTFVAGGCEGRGDVKALHDAFRGSQLDAALSFLRAHPGDVSPITVTLYGNDWLPVLLDTCNAKVACARKQAPSATKAFASRLTAILRRIRAAAPDAEIIVTGAWNPDPNSLGQLEAVYRSFETSIARAATAADARIARMLPVFNPTGSLQARKARLCAFTFICSKGDPHPTDAGYRAMADAILAASGYPRKP